MTNNIGQNFGEMKLIDRAKGGRHGPLRYTPSNIPPPAEHNPGLVSATVVAVLVWIEHTLAGIQNLGAELDLTLVGQFGPENRDVYAGFGSEPRECKNGIDDLPDILSLVQIDRLEQVMHGDAEFIGTGKECGNVFHLHKWDCRDPVLALAREELAHEFAQDYAVLEAGLKIWVRETLTNNGLDPLTSFNLALDAVLGGETLMDLFVHAIEPM